MKVEKSIEISSVSTKSFEYAVYQGLKKPPKRCRVSARHGLKNSPL
jgi:hypothetical protein